jgi:sulfofructose kinase
MTTSVTCVGLAVLDFVFSLDSSVALGHKNFASSLRVAPGGPAANAAVAIATMGGSSRLIARLGSDTVGDSIVTDLELLGVEVSRVRRVLGVVSPVSTVIVDDRGERTIVNHTDTDFFEGSDAVSSNDMADSRALLTDLRWPDGALSAIRHANKLGIPSVVDCDLTASSIHDAIISLATHLVFSEPALIRMTGRRDVDEALADIASTTEAFVGVTLGRRGFRWLERGTVRAFPGIDVEVVNTLGAGDVFHGAFALGLAEGRSIDDTIEWSSAAAALKCTGQGAGDGFPTRAEVTRLLEEVRA